MTSPRDLDTAQDAGLSAFALFHCNLAFSSIEEDQRAEVIKRCYWPMLELAEKHGPIGIEMTGFTLEEIAARDPAWIERARDLIARGRAELIGSGYAQMIGPLVPWRMTQANLRIGNGIYERLMGVRPRLALVNEQAYAAGLVPLYREAGYDGLLMDWDNPGAQNPHWPAETRYRPQRALGTDGHDIAVLWTNTVAFQKMQRLAHGDIGLGDYMAYLRGHRGADHVLCVYASDAEIFDFRPGRYKTEERMTGREWPMLADAFAAIGAEPGMRIVSPSRALAQGRHDGAPLRLETPPCPVPVKKQRKYNLSRWAVTGRDDVAVNAACQRIHDALVAQDGGDADWKKLCALWASDFRTHATAKRWAGFTADLAAMESHLAVPAPAMPALLAGNAIADRRIDIATPTLIARLDRRRGLCLESVHFAPHAKPVIGGLAHGHFDDISLQADWYSGNWVLEAPGEHKITDLEWCEARIEQQADGGVTAEARMDTPRGPVRKILHFHAGAPRIETTLILDWPDMGKGSLRLGHITLLPGAFDWNDIVLRTHNGGRDAETFALAGHDIDHGAPVSFLVSSSQGLGMTEGWAEMGDARTRIRVTVDRASAPLLGMLTHRRVGKSLFCQLQLSAMELDDTRKPQNWREGPRIFRYAIEAA